MLCVWMLVLVSDLRSATEAFGGKPKPTPAQRAAAQVTLTQADTFIRGLPDFVQATLERARSAAGRGYARIAPRAKVEAPKPAPEPTPPAVLPAQVFAKPEPAPTPPVSPNDDLTAALHDLTTAVSPDRRYTTRYLSLSGVPTEKRDEFAKVLAFTLNSLSWRSRIATFPRITPTLVRVDLTAIGWDKAFRAERIKSLAKAGAKTDEKLADIWEEIAKSDVYYFASQVNGGNLYRGWIDPTAEESLRVASYSTKAILRADWLVSKAWVESQFGGFYSQILLLPAKESDLYKLLVIDEARINEEPVLRHGAAIADSDAVARFNRELQLIPGTYGDAPFVWRTFDFKDEGAAAKDVLQSLAGTAKHDGREIIFSLPNSLHGYYLSNGEGAQAAIVPQDIALDRRVDAGARERNVLNGYKCVDCHGQHDGIWPFSDAVKPLTLQPGIGLAVIGGDKTGVTAKREAVEEYYLDMGRRIAAQTDSYATAVKACNGLEGGENASILVAAINAYSWDLVTLNQAAAEMGLGVNEARVQLRLSGNQTAVILSGGQPIRRGLWEAAFPAAMQGAEKYPWEGRATISVGY